MSSYIQIVKNDNSETIIRVEPAKKENDWQDAGFAELAEKIEIEFTKVMDTVNTTATGFIKGLDDLEKQVRPDEATIEFGLSVSGEVGITLAKAGSEAIFKISLTWKPKK